MRDFMRQYRSQFILGLGPKQQPIVDTDHATGHSEGVDSWIVNDHQIYATVVQFTVRDQLVREILQIIEQQRILHCGDLAAKDAQPGTAQLVFVLR